MVKNLSGNAGDTEMDPGWIPGSGRSPGEGNGNPLQYSCLENSTGRGPWWATVHGVDKRLRTHITHKGAVHQGLDLGPALQKLTGLSPGEPCGLFECLG